MTQELFDELLSNGENETVDFKEHSYFYNLLSNNKKDKDAELLKDIISFTNTVRDQSAYILIGVKEISGKGIPIGIDESEAIDNSIIQSKIKDKSSPVPKFSYYPFYNNEGKRFDIVEIPVAWYPSPCVSTVSIGNLLERNQVYIRRVSSNEKANYDEIIRIKAWLDALPKNINIKPAIGKSSVKSSAKTFEFDEETIQRLFGNEAAEDEDIDRLKEYYFKNDIFSKISVDLPLRILVGHKGIGKSALFKVAISEDSLKGKLPIIIKPDDVYNIANDSVEFLDLIRTWKEGLYNVIIKKVFAAFGIRKKIEFKYDDIQEELLSVIIEHLNLALDEGTLSSASQSILDKFLETPKIIVYIDDLDRGWLGGKSATNRISALLNSVRDISNTNKGIYFRISLRSDVYFLVRTSDESTDKIQSSVIWYRWSYHEILALLAKRVITFFGDEIDENSLKALHQGELSKYLNKIIEPVFAGEGRWENREMYKVLLSVIRKRPRDLVKLLTLAARNANSRGSNFILTKDLQAIFDEYSLDRIQDAINEYKSELPAIERLIFGMKPSKRSNKASDSFYYDTPSLLLKLNKLIERGDFKFSNGGIADAKQLAAFLYKINFITATKKQDDGFIDRKDFEINRYLAPKFEDFGYDWEVHMAYRWGLDPNVTKDVYSEIF
ncbi:helix-turn-helix domain-containing protein [Mucilaginibacter sp. NFR10]|uniref:AlbA family DNA-binding domain-containing protein n=1 Tax=Mucilaginibacter sp. NFR10 TaxID=1566292 RepID=UPI0008719EAC|nr:ATP-binding protein [Mucilaginibacter sp. NFR10]SCW53743.1 Putative DNA-binding domain-containing protein [Mucilaginibacter sp. NFR10]